MKAFVIAGERSGDRLGGALMAGLKQVAPDVCFDGIGGPEMAAQGLTSLFDMAELSVMGLSEIAPKYLHLRRRLAQTVDAVCAAAPDVLITIDSPEFCLRVANGVRARRPDQKVVHYVAPSVWAWRPGRAVHMAAHVDHVLALLPFEPPYMQRAGMSCDFVGHPVVSEPPPDPAEVAQLRGEAQQVVTLLPGSRRSEIARMLPRFVDTLGRSGLNDAQVLLPTFPHLVEQVQAHLGAIAPRVRIVEDSKKARLAAMAAGDVALATSGTVSLDLASVGTPMVIGYDMAWLSRQIIGRMVKVETVTLVNLVSETRAVPEFIGARCQPDLMADALRQVLADPSAQVRAMDDTMARLGRGGAAPGLRAARSVVGFLERAA